jgi:hypothetical protein
LGYFYQPKVDDLGEKVKRDGKIKENGHKVVPQFLKTPLPTLSSYPDGKERESSGI